MQVLFLQGHSTYFGRKRPLSGVFKTSTAATGTCVIVAGQSSHLLIRAGTEMSIKLVFHLTYTMMHGSTKLKFANYCTCFGLPSCPSSGVHKTVVAASGTDHTIWGAITFEEAGSPDSMICTIGCNYSYMYS